MCWNSRMWYHELKMTIELYQQKHEISLLLSALSYNILDALLSVSLIYTRLSLSYWSVVNRKQGLKFKKYFIKSNRYISLKICLIEFLLISCYFGIGSVSSYFIWLKMSLLDVKIRKKKERQTFRPHMGSLFSAINSKINSKFL